MPESQRLWYAEVITEETKRALEALVRTSLLGSFYLAGGTGLALHLGHRRSKDLDLFSEGMFESNRLIDKLGVLTDLLVVAEGEGTLHLNLEETKVSFLNYPYPLLFAPKSFLGVSVADPRDIGCMKLSAIASRGSKRDFIDLHVVAGRYGLRQVLEWFKEKLPRARYSRVHLLKSLTYFDDADCEPMPDMLAPVKWDEVKRFFSTEAPKLL
ncbi:MAG: nucleotidyl transferase AbiEii/AbiGii toxin family protein [Terriglobia bacterium]